jgi:multicomponent Na+:H+ antiporter subunit E
VRPAARLAYPVGTVVMLVTVWVLAWGSLTWANLVSGAAVAVGVLALVPEIGHPTRRVVVRPLPALRLLVRVVRDVLASNLQLTREVVTPRSGVALGIVRVPLAGCSDEVVTIVASLVALTPGTMPVDVARDPTVLYVHVLHLDDPEAVRRSIWSLRDQVVRAFGTRDAIAEVERVKAASRAGETGS